MLVFWGSPGRVTESFPSKAQSPRLLLRTPKQGLANKEKPHKTQLPVLSDLALTSELYLFRKLQAGHLLLPKGIFSRFQKKKMQRNCSFRILRVSAPRADPLLQIRFLVLVSSIFSDHRISHTSTGGALHGTVSQKNPVSIWLNSSNQDNNCAS